MNTPSKPQWPATRYRRRTFIPLHSRAGGEIGCLIWRGDGMEALTADGTSLGKFATRREATDALWGWWRRHRSSAASRR
jgi:hypothetical protein